METVWTGAILRLGGAETVAIGDHEDGGVRTQRARSPAVTAAAPSNSGSVCASEAMVATTRWTCSVERPNPVVRGT